METDFNKQKEECDHPMVYRTLSGQCFAIYLVKDYIEFLEKLWIEEREL